MYFRYIQVIRPVQYGELMSKIKQYYGLDLCMNLSNGEFFVPLNNQADLNMAIDMVDRSPHMRSLRVFLVRPADASSPTSPPPQSLRLFDNQSTVSTIHLCKTQRLSLGTSSLADLAGLRGRPPPAQFSLLLCSFWKNNQVPSHRLELAPTRLGKSWTHHLIH